MTDVEDMTDAEYDAMVERFVFGTPPAATSMLTKAAYVGGAVAVALLGAWSFL